MKVIFMGSGLFATIQLQGLFDDSMVEVIGVVTQPDKPMGRKKELTPTPVKALALKLGLEVIEAGRSKQILEQVDLSEADFIVVADYGVLLNQKVLDAPKIDCINVHGSILPYYRGASPIQAVLVNGEEKTGVTIMRMVKGLDAGAIYKIVEYVIEKDDVAPVLYEKLAKLGVDALIEVLKDVYKNGTKPVEQDDEKATFCGKIEKSDGEVNFVEMSAKEIWDKYRGYYFWPKIFFLNEEKRYVIHECDFYVEGTLPAGTWEYLDGELRVGTKKGELIISKIQPEGKKVMQARDFWSGNSSVFE